MPNPFASIDEDRPRIGLMVNPVRPAPKKAAVDHSEAIAIYKQYKIKKAELVRHQEYAERVCKATNAPGMTPVMPLATMGTNGGCLLCDHCGLPLILEGGQYNNVPVDQAWAKASESQKSPRWLSWIKRGCVFRIVDNGTLRVYHGYENNPKECCVLGYAAIQKADEAFVTDLSKATLIAHFLEDSGISNVNEILTDIVTVMYRFDPGFGVNQP